MLHWLPGKEWPGGIVKTMAISLSHLLTATHNSVKSYGFRVYNENANWSQHQNLSGTLPGSVHWILLSSALVGTQVFIPGRLSWHFVMTGDTECHFLYLLAIPMSLETCLFKYFPILRWLCLIQSGGPKYTHPECTLINSSSCTTLYPSCSSHPSLSLLVPFAFISFTPPMSCIWEKTLRLVF